MTADKSIFAHYGKETIFGDGYLIYNDETGQVNYLVVVMVDIINNITNRIPNFLFTPEPATLLFLLGIGGLFLRRRSK